MGRDLSNRASGMLPGSNIENEIARRRALKSQGMGLVRLSGGGNSFQDEKATQAVFQIKINNIDTADHVIALHPGNLATVAEILTVAGVTVGAIAKDGVVITDKVTCTTKTNTTLGFFQRFVNSNPTRIVRMQIASNEADQLDETITLAKINPTQKLGSIEVTPSNSKKATDTNVKLVIVDLPNYQLDDQSVWFVNLLAGRTLTINLYLGASRNDAATLEELASAALGN
jgi:hypothetical protein